MKYNLKYYNDVNFEWLACFLSKELDIEINEIFTKTLGIFFRFVNHDIDSVELLENRQNEGLEFVINREGIYDNLPHGLFHRVMSTKSLALNKEELRAIVKEEAEKEKSARTFFHIFENELLRANVHNMSKIIDIKEQNFGFAFEQILTLLPFNTDLFTRDQLTRIINVFPFLQEYQGNIYNKINHLCSYILDCTFDLHLFTRIKETKISEEEICTLDSCFLGWDACLGASIPMHQLIAQVIFDEEKNQYEEENKQSLNTRMKTILEWILPIYYNHEIKFISKAEKIFLGQESAVLN